MIRLEFLLEEKSMENVLKIILPRILPTEYRLNENYFLRPHSGKSDLQKSIPKKVKVFSHYHEKVILIILQDQDSSNCAELKIKLAQLCKNNGNCPFLIRIVCRELEAWYLGDMSAIESAYPGFAAQKHRGKKKFRNPDHCNAFDELRKLIPEFQKHTASNKIPQFFNLKQNQSPSFQNFKSGLTRILKEHSH
jgi:hypothetical protein